jgi:hypothetical protein
MQLDKKLLVMSLKEWFQTKGMYSQGVREALKSQYMRCITLLNSEWKDVKKSSDNFSVHGINKACSKWNASVSSDCGLLACNTMLSEEQAASIFRVEVCKVRMQVRLYRQNVIKAVNNIHGSLLPQRCNQQAPSETLVPFYWTAWHHIPEASRECYLHIHCHENLTFTQCSLHARIIMELLEIMCEHMLVA